ncbi:hypothetical protein [Hyalangium gracile]|uniref:hypothetical protein n=1 Tax=Hyalangium gracile TaxID=394092 RepID=UPI001CCCEE75|nr:hypothetical protein [Hyalangium gracile]
MSPKFSRFLHLERSRGEGAKPEAATRLQSGNRFENPVEREAAPQAGSVPDAHLERFRGEAPLALSEPQAEKERFPRCARCESDNGRFARECTVCGADLNTPQQRAYNEQLWETRKQDLAREREATEALGQQRLAEEKQKDDARYRQMLEKLREEEQRSSFNWDFFLGDTPIGWRLLSLISNPVTRTGVLILSILVPVGLWRYGTGQVRAAGIIIGLIVLMLLLPTHRRSRWWR